MNHFSKSVFALCCGVLLLERVAAASSADSDPAASREPRPGMAEPTPPTPCYYVVEFSRRYVRSQAARLASLPWITQSTNLSDDGLLRMLAQRNGAALYGVWRMVCACSASARHKGCLLTDTYSAHDSVSLARKLRVSPKTVKACLDLCCELNWIAKAPSVEAAIEAVNSERPSERTSERTSERPSEPKQEQEQEQEKEKASKQATPLPEKGSNSPAAHEISTRLQKLGIAPAVADSLAEAHAFAAIDRVVMRGRRAEKAGKLKVDIAAYIVGALNKQNGRHA